MTFLFSVTSERSFYVMTTWRLSQITMWTQYNERHFWCLNGALKRLFYNNCFSPFWIHTKSLLNESHARSSSCFPLCSSVLNTARLLFMSYHITYYVYSVHSDLGAAL